jgi:type II secretory pathway component HofQ
MFRFTIRDVLWLTVVVGLACAWGVERRESRKAINAREQVNAELGQVITIDFVEMPLLDAMQFINVNHRVPVRFADDIDFSKIVTAKFTNVPLRAALDGMLKPLGLEYEVNNGWIMIKPRVR